MEQQMTGYPSIDKPWLKYYSEEEEKQRIPSPDCSMIDFLRQCNANNLDWPALDYFGAKTSFRDLFDAIEHTAAALQKRGVKKGDFVSLCGLNTPEFYTLLYAVNQVGAVSNWLGLTSPVLDLREQLASTGTRLVFVIDVATDKIREAAQGTGVTEIISIPLSASMPPLLRFLYGLKSHSSKSDSVSWKKFLRTAGDEKAQNVTIRGDDLAMIEYTGGSTGVPKGVMLSNKNLNSYYVNFSKANACDLSNYRRRDRFLAGVPLFLAFGVSSACHGPLSHGMTLVLAPDPNPETLGQLILKRKPNHIIAGRVQIDGFVQAANSSRANLSYIRSIMYGGEASNRFWEQKTAALLQKHRMEASLLNGYGMTECSACILVATKECPEELLPLGNVNAKVTDPDDPYTELGYDTEGELCLCSDTVMLGYYQKEEETERLIFEADGQRWLRTRDLARISPDGHILLTGRIKRIYHKLSPERLDVRVYPMRIEECISALPEIEKCAVVGVKDDKTAYRTIAYLILKDQTSNTAAARKRIEENCKSSLPESHVPDEYVFVTEFPLTRAGKVDYRALESIADKGE